MISHQVIWRVYSRNAVQWHLRVVHDVDLAYHPLADPLLCFVDCSLEAVHCISQ